MHYLSFGSHNNFIALISKLVHLDCDKQNFWLQPLHRLTPCAKCNSWHWSCGLNYTSYNVFVLTINNFLKNNFTNMFMNRTSLKNLKTTWRPSSKTMVEESLNSLNFFWRNLIDWQFEKKLEQFITTSFTLKKASHNGFVSTCIAFGEKNVEKIANTWRKLKLHLGLFVSTPSMSTSEEDTGGGSNEFFIKISAKTSLTPNYFLA
jgi:hypothetical protein